MTAGCVTTPVWKNTMSLLPVQVEDAAEMGMADAMHVVAEIAKVSARWNPDGTDTGHWLVTGTARESITPYVAGKPVDFPVFNVTEPTYHHVHRSPEGDGASQVMPLPGHVIGGLTMTEQHSAELQGFEISGSRTMAPGEPITVEAIKQNEQVIWDAIRGAFKLIV